MRKFLLLGLAVSLVATGWAGPVFNNLIIGTTQEHSNMLPWEGGADTKENVMALMNIGMTYFDSNAVLQPGLVTELPTEGNGRLVLTRDGDGNVTSQAVTWTLRDDANWSDGTPITCEDAVFTFEVQNTPEVPVTTRSFSNLVDSVECDASDNKTFTITYGTLNLFFDNVAGSIGLARFGDIAPKHVWEPIYRDVMAKIADSPGNAADIMTADFLGAAPATGQGTVVGSGPFKFEQWEINQFLRVSRRGDFFLSPPGPAENYVQEITVRFITNQATLISAIVSGEIDASDDIGLAGQDPAVLAAQLGDTGIVEVSPGTFIEKLNINIMGGLKDIPVLAAISGFVDQIQFQITEDLLLHDKRTRHALIQAIDRDDLASAVFPGSIVSNSFMVGGDVGFTDQLNQWEYNPQAARDLLAEIGWADSDGDGVLDRTQDGRKIDFNLPWVATTAPFRVRTGEILQEFYADVGIALQPQNLPASVVFATEHISHASDCAWGGMFEYAEGGGIGKAPADAISNELWANDYLESPVDPEPENIPLASNGFGGATFTGWYNPEYDQLRADALSTFDVDERASILVRMQEIFNDELPWIPLYERPEIVTEKNGLLNYGKITPLVRTQFWNAWEWGWEQNGAVEAR